MNFHDTRGMYDEIAAWVEAHDVEIDWKAVMNCKWWVGPDDWEPPPKWSMPAPFPKKLGPNLVTKLIFSSEKGGLVIPPMLVDPLDSPDEPAPIAAPGGEGIGAAGSHATGTGLSWWEKFLVTLEKVAVEQVSIKLISIEERRRLVKMAILEEELEKREKEANRVRVRRQVSGKAKFRIMRREEKWLRRMASLGKLSAIEELRRRGIGSEEEHEKWMGAVERMKGLAAKMREKRNEKMRKKGTLEEGVMEVEGKEGEKVGPKEPREVELEVVRVGPNPRILLCRFDGGECRVRVKTALNFRRGMKLRMVEPDGVGVAEPWEYHGILPRYGGRW